jgi:ABC-type cobalamin transport system permease subunit
MKNSDGRQQAKVLDKGINLLIAVVIWQGRRGRGIERMTLEERRANQRGTAMEHILCNVVASREDFIRPGVVEPGQLRGERLG